MTYKCENCKFRFVTHRVAAYRRWELNNCSKGMQGDVQSFNEDNWCEKHELRTTKEGV